MQGARGSLNRRFRSRFFCIAISATWGFVTSSFHYSRALKCRGKSDTQRLHFHDKQEIGNTKIYLIYICRTSSPFYSHETHCTLELLCVQRSNLEVINSPRSRAYCARPSNECKPMSEYKSPLSFAKYMTNRYELFINNRQFVRTDSFEILSMASGTFSHEK